MDTTGWQEAYQMIKWIFIILFILFVVGGIVSGIKSKQDDE